MEPQQPIGSTGQPQAQPQTQPLVQPTGQPQAQPQTQPLVQPTGQPQAQPQTQPLVQPTGQVNNYPQTPPTTDKPVSVKKIILAVVAVVIGLFIILIVLVVLFVFSGINEKANIQVKSQNVIQDIQSDNPNAIYAMISPSYRQSISRSSFNSYINSLSSTLQGNATLDNVNIISASNNRQEGIVEYTITTNSGNAYIQIAVSGSSPYYVNHILISSTPFN